MTLSGTRCKKSGRIWWMFAVFFAVLTVPIPLLAETVKMPMTIDFSLLRELIVRQAYPEPDERVAILETENGCSEIWLATPQLGEENGEVRFQTDIRIVWGTPLGSKCLVPLRWAGSIVFWQRPEIDGDWRLRFVTRDSSLLNQQGEKPAIPGIIWNQVKKYVHGYIDSLVIDLSPPVENLKQFMVPQDREPELSAAESFLATMRPDQPQVEKQGLAMNILADYDATSAAGEDEIDALFGEKPETREQIQSLWQTWDALLVNMINQFSTLDLTAKERLLILDTLLTMRYEFSEVIGGPGLTTYFVRRQFIASWLALKPLFQRRLTAGPPDSLLGYLSFFTAADALVVLDRIGPLLGIDISREGFYRMAHMLSDQPLDETGAVNDKLREVLGLGGPLEPPLVEMPPGEITPREATPVMEPKGGSLLLREGDADQKRQPSEPERSPPEPDAELLNDIDTREGDWFDLRQLFGLREACAATSRQLDIVTSWTAEMTPAGQVLAKMRKVFTRTAAGLEKKMDDIVGEKGWGQWMIEATAWQESCFRQFVVKNDKITYLLSYNNTSVGVMQVNEKVWRGIYDMQELRWNTEYNILAGSEILALYLNRYLAGHKDFQRHSATSGRLYLATWLYSLYNGGPGQVKKYSRRSGSGKPSRLDLSFKEKFDQVRGGDWHTKVDCLSPG